MGNEVGAICIHAEAPDRLIHLLRECDYWTLGPTVRDGTIICYEFDSAQDLPSGWTDRQKAGQDRLERRTDHARFGYNFEPRLW